MKKATEYTIGEIKFRAMLSGRKDVMAAVTVVHSFALEYAVIEERDERAALAAIEMRRRQEENEARERREREREQKSPPRFQF